MYLEDPIIARATLDGLLAQRRTMEEQRKKLDEYIATYSNIVGSTGTQQTVHGIQTLADVPDLPEGEKRKSVSLSQEQRNRIAAAQRKRWAKYHKDKAAAAKKAV
jgi:hypothetical protein